MPRVADRTLDASIVESARADYFSDIITHAAAWVADGYRVFPKLLWNRPSDGKLIKGAWKLCAACSPDSSLAASCPDCECGNLLCHTKHRATLDPHVFAEVLAAAFGRTKSPAMVGLAVVIPRNGLCLDIDRHDGKLDGIELYSALCALGYTDGKLDGSGEAITDTRLIVTPSQGMHLHYLGLPPGMALPHHVLKEARSFEVKAPGDDITVPPTITPGNRCYADAGVLIHATSTKLDGIEHITPQLSPITRATPRLLAVLADAYAEQHPAPTRPSTDVRNDMNYTARALQAAGVNASTPLERTTQLLDRLREQGRKVITTGRDKWNAQCPAHADKSPSLSVAVGDKSVLLKCWAGCTREEILNALNLGGNK